MKVSDGLADIRVNTNQDNFNILQAKLRLVSSDLCREQSPAWRTVINHANIAHLPENTSLLQPSTPCSHFILLLSGTVRVFQQTPDDREITLYRLKAGDLCALSINSLLHRDAFGAFATSESPVMALMLNRDAFFQAMSASPVFQEYVLTRMSDRFHDIMELMKTTIFEGLDTRLICLLGRMTRTSGTDLIHITHREIACELGTSREVVSRLLKALEHKGCIQLGRGSIRVLM